MYSDDLWRLHSIMKIAKAVEDRQGYIPPHIEEMMRFRIDEIGEKYNLPVCLNGDEPEEGAHLIRKCETIIKYLETLEDNNNTEKTRT